MKTLFAFASLLLFFLPTMAQEPQILLDIPYIPDGQERQVLDVYLPENVDSPVPTLLMIHGGGFIFGDKDEMRSVAQSFQEMGYATVAPNYRLAPDYTYPAQIEDVFCALAWTIHHAEEYGFDPTRLVLVGESAGANAAALLGTVDTPQQYLANCPYSLPDDFQARAVVAYYMPVNLTSCDCVAAQQMAALYLGIPEGEAGQLETMQDRWADASPLYWIDDNDPPFLLVHGERDSLVPLSESLAFQSAYEEVGGEVLLITIPLLNHGFFRLTWLPPVQNALEEVQQYIEAALAQ